MTFIEGLIPILFAWHVLGALIWFTSQWENCFMDLELVNPLFNKNRYRVNWFGAIMIAMFFNLICPIASLCYWFYKLCTIGA